MKICYLTKIADIIDGRSRVFSIWYFNSVFVFIWKQL